MRLLRSLVLATVVTVVLFLGAGELALRWRLNQPAADVTVTETRGWQQDDPLLGYVPAPGSHPSPERGMDEVTINQRGFRGPPLDVPKPPGTTRIVLLGGSVVYGIGANDDETISQQLAGLLGERLGRPVEVVNGGVPGYTSTAEALMLQTRALAAEPDAVVALHGFNDVYRAATDTWGAYHLEYRRRLVDLMPGHPLIGAIDRYVVGPSALGYYLRNFYMVRTRPTLPASYQGPYREQYIQSNGAAVELYANNVALMKALAGPRPFFVALQPVLELTRKSLTPAEQAIQAEVVRGSLFEGAVRTMYPQIEAAGRRATSELGVPYLSLLDAFDTRAETTFQFDDVHLTPFGNRILAERLADWLAPALREQPRASA